jgi:hypothetical protein
MRLSYLGTVPSISLLLALPVLAQNDAQVSWRGMQPPVPHQPSLSLGDGLGFEQTQESGSERWPDSWEISCSVDLSLSGFDVKSDPSCYFECQ